MTINEKYVFTNDLVFLQICSTTKNTSDGCVYILINTFLICFCLLFSFRFFSTTITYKKKKGPKRVYLFPNLRGVALTVTPLKVFCCDCFDPSPHSVTSDPSPADETRYSGYDQHARGDWWCFHKCTGASASTSRTRDLEHTHTHTYSGHLLLRKTTGGVIR